MQEISAWKDADETAPEPLPPAWRTVWELSPVLAPEVLEPWRPLLETLTSLTGKPAPARPEPSHTQAPRRHPASITSERHDPG
ncbi:hypothetical protein CLM62_40600 [Streptomyces sp. SA15]|uniref:hypothetical protein n=1 Tax=Streptomyces sp. SA15 TaxID=934019 RepID=UPI000BAEDF7C|nr:hypothetical protein [Streptomyces sp. SA15]PAZ10469.1 hypothetical protein CLM62_40600 [Streptomyces sp. SA15]